MLPAGSSSRRYWLVAAQLLLVAAALLAILILVTRISAKSSGDDACRRRREAMLVLPPEPDSDQQIVDNIVDHLTLPRDKPCQRELALGGEPYEFNPKTGSAAVVGIKITCLDPDLSLRRHDCLVVSSRPAIEASFDAAARLFGCEVHSYGPDLGRRLPPSLTALPGGRRPVSLLALQLDGREMADMLHSPPAALERVEQLTVRLNLTEALTPVRGSVGGMPLLRRLYGGLLRLQEAGFHPFSSTEVQDEGVVAVNLPGQQEPITTVREIGWMKVLCDETQ